MKSQSAQEVSDEDFAKRAERWPHDTPDTKEAYWIREIFDGEPLSLEVCLCTGSDPTYAHTGLFPLPTAARTAVRYVLSRACS